MPNQRWSRSIRGLQMTLYGPAGCNRAFRRVLLCFPSSSSYLYTVWDCMANELFVCFWLYMSSSAWIQRPPISRIIHRNVVKARLVHFLIVSLNRNLRRVRLFRCATLFLSVRTATSDVDHRTPCTSKYTLCTTCSLTYDINFCLLDHFGPHLLSVHHPTLSRRLKRRLCPR